MARYGSIMYSENMCSPLLYESRAHSIKLNAAIEIAMIRDWPASSPLIPAKMLIAFVQKTANMPI